MQNLFKKSLKSALFLLLVFTSFSARAEIKASVRPSTIREGEKTELVLSSEDKVLTNVALNTADLEKSFRITNRGTQIQTSYINGKSRTYSLLTLTLSPLRSGDLVVPSLQVEGEKTQKLLVKVLPASSSVTISSDELQKKEAFTENWDDSDDFDEIGFDNSVENETDKKDKTSFDEKGKSAKASVFLESDLSSKKTYVDGALVYTVKLYYNTTSLNGQIADPVLPGARVERAEKDKTYQTTKNGVLYDVVERTFFLFPTKAGTFDISPATFSGTVAMPLNKKEKEMFSPFGITADVLYMGRMGQKEIFLKAPVVSVTVMPVPEKERKKTWLPAKSLSLSESWSPKEAEISLGEAVTRTITVRAQDVSEDILPRLVMPQEQGVKVYEGEEKSSFEIQNGQYVAILEKSFVFMPTKTGKIRLPDVRITWFNTEKEKAQEAVLPAKTLLVVQKEGTKETNLSLSEKGGSAGTSNPQSHFQENMPDGQNASKGQAPDGDRKETTPRKEDVSKSHTLQTADLFLLGIGVGLGISLTVVVGFLFLLLRKNKKTNQNQKEKKPLKDLYPY